MRSELHVAGGHRIAALAAAAALAIAAPASTADSATAAGTGKLRAGAGQADITPPKTGYYLGGWTRADRVARGQSTRLYSNALVLQRGRRKVALVAAELFAIPAGLQEDVARALKRLGYDRTSILLAASHTHSGPGGFFNNPTYNTAAPSAETVTDPLSFVRLIDPLPADRQLYTFLVERIAASIRRADRDRAPAALGWGHGMLADLTQNRSIEAHLANHGIHESFGQGRPDQDPDGVVHTIDPAVEVLRVDKLVRRRGRTRRVPIGAYSNFANHGTVVKAETEAYSGDHHAAAWRVFSRRVRRAGRVPARQTVVNVYPNGAEGDLTAGIAHTGIDGAIRVGTREADAMFSAWRAAGRRLSRTPALDLRWTRSCFCGAQTATGPVDSQGRQGLGFLTGSEEGRGPLFDVTGVPLEGVTSPVDDPVQGNKVALPVGDPPPAVPLSVVRIGTGVIAAIPAEATKEAGVRLSAAVTAPLRRSGVRHTMLVGLANDYVQYISTPEEYGQQSYEGASTLFGRNEGTFFAERLGELARALAAGRAAPEPYPFDPSYGVQPDGRPYPKGADSGKITEQPAARAAAGDTVKLAWAGGPAGGDRPLDRAFVTAQRRVGTRWRAVDSDLGLRMLWRVDDEGRHTLEWKVPSSARGGSYRLRVSATRYALVSRKFVVVGRRR